MTSAEFRRIALSMPDAIESSHMNHPDFRAGGRIFATLNEDETRGMVSLTPEQQAEFVHDEPKMFEPVPGGWGRRGATSVMLRSAKAPAVRAAMETAWRNVTTKPVRPV